MGVRVGVGVGGGGPGGWLGGAVSAWLDWSVGCRRGVPGGWDAAGATVSGAGGSGAVRVRECWAMRRGPGRRAREQIFGQPAHGAPLPAASRRPRSAGSDRLGPAREAAARSPPPGRRRDGEHPKGVAPGQRGGDVAGDEEADAGADQFAGEDEPVDSRRSAAGNRSPVSDATAGPAMATTAPTASRVINKIGYEPQAAGPPTMSRSRASTSRWNHRCSRPPVRSGRARSRRPVVGGRSLAGFIQAAGRVTGRRGVAGALVTADQW